MEIALRTALAILRWLTGRRPVVLRCLILPILVTYSVRMEMFYYYQVYMSILFPSCYSCFGGIFRKEDAPCIAPADQFPGNRTHLDSVVAV